ncbi:MAG: FecR domain-containing protein [Candidatus Sphingomonas phytovorans]|nr:FecR domain-containing protein [Sphingomonas sp.]WEK01239.1 MAG: FecR domain-containing protein [Sphingomonas sp.]
MKGARTVQGDESTIIDQAIEWHLRQTEMSDQDWESFVTWLEISPAHASAYDSVVMQEHLIDRIDFPIEVVRRELPARRWPWAVGGLAAAAAAVALLMPLVTPARPSTYDVATRAGERRTLHLADGSRIEMSGDTRLRLDHSRPRLVDLERGEATLHVRHDPANPFTVTSGDLTVRDLGTVFNLARDGDRLAVEVSSGSVLFQPDRESVELAPGDALVVREDSHTMTRAKISPASVGGWRTGTLSFDGEPLGSVFASIHRLNATQVVLEGGLSQRPFTGMVKLTGAADRDIPHLAALIGATWRRDGDRWILAGSTAPSR